MTPADDHILSYNKKNLSRISKERSTLSIAYDKKILIEYLKNELNLENIITWFCEHLMQEQIDELYLFYAIATTEVNYTSSHA